MINRPKGTLDVLPRDAWKWHKIEDAARLTARLFNLKEIRTPNFEHTELFLRGVGGTTDIVNKEMYTFEDKGGRSMTLKPEGTAGVARAYIENGLFNEAQPLKMYYFTPVYRYENTQAGRYREHHQFGVELYGADGCSADAEAILIARKFLSLSGVTDLELNINSIGCSECRAEYNRALRETLGGRLKEMCPECNTRFSRNPLRILDCKEAACRAAVAAAPRITDCLCAECRAHFDGVRELLHMYGAEFTVNPFIVRGLDYYNRTVFEFVADGARAQGTVCGGGRYDGLVSDVGGRATPAVGFGLGLERLLGVMEAQGLLSGGGETPEIFVVCADGAARQTCMRLVNVLRDGGVSAEFDHLNRSVKAQFKYADKTGARFVTAIGGDELSGGVLRVKEMATGIERQCALQALLNGDIGGIAAEK
jgi:histidyl-tRNA synthetase